MTLKDREIVDCIVIGAGVAGLAAAREISRAGRRVVVLEARNRIGGRIHTIRDPSSVLPIELGAEFVHGEAEETFTILRAARAIVDQLPDSHYWVGDGTLRVVPDFWEKIAAAGRDIAKRLGRAKTQDLSFLRYLERSSWPPKLRRLLLQYVEGYHAADPARISARFLAVGSDEIDGQANTRQFRIVSGYDAVVEWLQRALDPGLVEIRLNTVVEAVEWRRRDVVLRCSGDAGRAERSWRARAAVVTVPSAVLAAGAIRFDPDLPEKRRAAQRLEPGQVFKMVLRFREPFWAEDAFIRKRMTAERKTYDPLTFLHDMGEKVGTWWTALPTRTNTLTAWAGGPKAEHLLDRDPPARVDEVLAALARALSVPRTLIDDLFDAEWLHDWRADPFSRCAYSYPGVGGVPAQKALARPVGNTIFFAGEATDAAQTATVAGAIASGRRAGKEVVGVGEGIGNRE